MSVVGLIAKVWLQPVLGLVTVALQGRSEVAKMLRACDPIVVSTLSMKVSQKSVPTEV